MGEIRTKIVLRNDSTVNWVANESVVLLKGEVGIEFTESGAPKLKIGDGRSTWSELSYFADGDVASLETAISELSGKHDTEVAALQAKDTEIEASVTAVEALIGAVTEGKTIVELIAEAQAAATYDDTSLAARVTANEESIVILNGDDTVEGSVDKKVADKVTEEINAFADKISDDGTVNTLKELVDYVAEHGSEAAEMSAEIAKKVNKEEGKSLIATTLIEKLEGIAVGAQVNVIDSVDEAQFAIDESKNLTLLEVAISKVAGLQDALDGKVDKEEGSRLITAGEIAKLSKLVIDEETGDVGLSGSISAENVVGLSEALDKKVNAEEGKSLVADTLIAKIEAIEEGAQANKIEVVKVGDTLLEIADKTVVIPVGAGLKSSDEVTVAEDGTLGVGEINVNKLVQADGEYVILNGGAATIQ